MSQVEVRENLRGWKYFEFKGTLFFSEDLPSVGTELEDLFSYHSVGEGLVCECWWDDDTPSGRGTCTAKEE